MWGVKPSALPPPPPPAPPARGAPRRRNNKMTYANMVQYFTGTLDGVRRMSHCPSLSSQADCNTALTSVCCAPRVVPPAFISIYNRRCCFPSPSLYTCTPARNEEIWRSGRLFLFFITTDKSAPPFPLCYSGRSAAGSPTLLSTPCGGEWCDAQQRICRRGRVEKDRCL